MVYARRVPQAKENAPPDLTPLPGKQTGAEVTKLVGLMQRLLAPDGCPGPRADAGDAGPLPRRGDLRGGRRAGRGGRRRPPRGAGRPVAADPLPVGARVRRG